MTPSAASPHFVPRRVLLFSGHRVDAPGRAPARFPSALVPRAAQAIGDALDALGAGPADLAISQAASGGDLLFADACAARGVRLCVMLPMAEPAFIAESVQGSAGTDDWAARYAAMRANLSQPPQVLADVRPDPVDPPWPQADVFRRCNAWLLDTAIAHGVGKLHFICLWDGSDAGGPGGTAHMVREVARVGAPMSWIDTRALAAPTRLVAP
ncbi:MAG: hypothetical protein ABI781_02630 [Burkholderiales bacterium]